MLFKYLLVIFLTFESAAFADDCKAPKGLTVKLWGERHESVHSAILLRTMLKGAKTGFIRGFHEALPATANDDPKLKEKYFEAEGIKLNKLQLDNIYGIDSDAHKLMLTAGMAFLYFRRDAVTPIGANADHYLNLASAILQPAMLTLVRNSPELAQYRFLFKKGEMFYLTLGIGMLNRELHPLFMDFLKRLHAVAKKEAERLHYPIGDPDRNIEGFPELESNDDDVLAYMRETSAIRDGIIARSIAGILCASESKIPAHVTIGAGHLAGVSEMLRQLVPQADIVTRDLRDEK